MMCPVPDAAGNRAHDEPAAQAARTAVDPPTHILLERRHEDGEDLHADRIGTDGSVWRQTTVRASFDAAGTLTIGRGPAVWERLGTLDTRALRLLRAEIADSGAAALPDEVRPDFAVLHGNDVVWTFTDRAVVVRDAPGTTTPALDRLSAALDAAIAAVHD